MARHPEPQFVIDWRNRKAPQVCHTCGWYDKKGLCNFHNEEPPKEFANTQGACNSWIEEVPF